MLNIGGPVDKRLPWIRSLHSLDSVRDISNAAERAKQIEIDGRALGDALRGESKVVSVHSIDGHLTPYPVRFAFNGALGGDLLMIQNRALLVQVMAEGKLRNILFNPTDPIASSQTPYFLGLAERSSAFFNRIFGPKPSRIPAALNQLGLRCEDIDVICFDHFHTQDLRPILGTHNTPGQFPNALLLAPRSEWMDWDALHPMQKAFFIAKGKEGVDPRRVVLTDTDLVLGDGALLVRTPGHTSGNQTLFVNTHQGVWGSSENGTSADAWTPRASRLAGLRKTAAYYDVDVILNTNTPEFYGEQYLSMLLERAIVDRVAQAPEFVQMLPSSEVRWHWAAPHVRPSMVFGGLQDGKVQLKAN